MSDVDSVEFSHPEADNHYENPELKARIQREENWGKFFLNGVNKISNGEDSTQIITDWAKTVANLEDDSVQRLTSLNAAQDELNTSERSELVGNERKFLADLEEALKTGGGLLYLDIDKFKEINDSLGHETGDKTIEWFANILRTSIRQEQRELSTLPLDEAYQIHGDEHAIILQGVKTPEELKLASERIREAINNATPIIEGVKPTASIGGTILDQELGVLGNVREADRAMFLAKQNGRNISYIKGHDDQIPQAA